jgi:hypothetical protein
VQFGRPSTTDTWVLVYGYSNASQYEDILRRFADFGHILAHRGRSNWIAIQYESQLEAEKALCHQHMELQAAADGEVIYCGVTRLQDNDPKLLQPHQPSSSNTTTTKKTSQNTPKSLWTATETETKTTTSSTTLADNNDTVVAGRLTDDGRIRQNEITENDILVGVEGNKEKSSRQYESICTKFLKWALKIEEE